MDIFGLDKPKRPPEGLEFLTTVYDNAELAVVRSILEGAGIPYLIKERGIGSTVIGYSMFGTDIYVRQEDLEVASGLLESDADEGAGNGDHNEDGARDSGDTTGNPE
ncbi:MAG TPA: DUF2007 domain-containing protein [Bacillota bacterium]|nr:DUF2007 domain-containing protein [Bacillota bacterium]